MPMGNRIAALIAIGAIMTISIWSFGCSNGTGDRSNGSGHGQKEDGHAGSAAWSYSGSTGPENWGSLSPDYADCASGRMQSPVDIVDASPAKGPELILDYKPSPLRIVNNGHTVQVNYGPGSVLTVAGKPFGLLQFHFHAPSEHAIAGSRAPMEAHFVHGNADGSLAVVGVMMQAGRHNDPLALVFANIPDEAGPEVAIADATIDASAMLPSESGAYFHYKGSLTTPPCSQGVHWFVVANAIEVSTEQIGSFERISGPNARPLQGLNDRLLIASP
jgi:carbonic anhydrase